MLAIRMQRTGRKGHAMFRMIVQDSRRTPTSGKVVANLGSFDPHAKTVTLNKEKATFYLEHGAQPSERVARLLKNEGVELPDWVTLSENKARTTRNPDKRRSTSPAAPAEEAPAVEAETPAEPAPETTEVAEVAEVPAAEEVATEEAAPEVEAETEAKA